MNDRLDVEPRFMAAFVTAWRLLTPPTGFTAMPWVVARGAAYSPQNLEPYVFIDFMSDRGEISGTPGSRVFNLPSIVQVSVNVQSGSGAANKADALMVLVAQVIDGIDVAGLNLYGARKPYDLPAPPAGYYARAVDVPCRYVGP